MTSFVVRGGPGGSWQDWAVETSVTAVGWVELPDLSSVASKDELQQLLDESRVDEPKNKTAMLWAFVDEMRPGDIVVQPLTGTDGVAIGEVVGDYRREQDGPAGVGHVRDVSWLDPRVAKVRFARDLRTYFDHPATLTPMRKARDPDRRLRHVAETDLPDGFEPGGPLEGFTEPTVFELSKVTELPDDPSVHVVWDSQGELLYVGYTGRPLRERLQEHVSGDRQASILHQRVGELLDESETPAGRDEIAGYLSHCTISWRTADDPESLKEQLVELLSPRFEGATQARQYWWVNQGQTYAEEREAGIMWAPIQNAQGATYKYWSDLKRARAGDTVFHYADGAIQAVGSVVRLAREAKKPLTSAAWEDDGYLVDVEYVDLDAPIPLQEIPEDWRKSEGGPFNVNGGVKQGYFFPISSVLADQMSQRFADRLPGELFDGSSQGQVESEREAWIFQGNPKWWPMWEMLRDARIGETDNWAVNQHRDRISEGDVMLLWVSGKEAGIYAVTELTSEPYELEEPDDFGDTKVDFVWRKLLDPPLLRDELRSHPVLKDLTVLRAPNQTNFRVTPEQWRVLSDLVGWHEEERPSMDWLERETLWDRDRLESLVATLQDETNQSYQVVLAGPPGTGKTHVAQKLSHYLTDGQPGAQRLVQFHPSYSYEEFMEGLRPVAEDGAVEFRVEPGIVLDVCQHIADDDDQLHVLVIDEMNRANLSSVLGELMYLFEYRDQEINLRFTRRFSLPKQLRFIGTMNTADRSARSIDIALRRRFDVFECAPERPILERFYKRADNTNHVPSLYDGFDELNKRLTELRDRHHTIGHTFFMASDLTVERLRHVWRHKIVPLLEEYFLDQPDRVAEFEIEKFWPEAS